MKFALQECLNDGIGFPTTQDLKHPPAIVVVIFGTNNK